MARKVIRMTESEFKKKVLDISKEQLNEYSEGFMNKIVQKFKDEATSEVEMYIQRFQEISQNLKNRDISSYSWEELKQVVDSHKNKYQRNAIKYIDNVADKKNKEFGYDKSHGDSYMRDYMTKNIMKSWKNDRY
jgi:hypothetical protein